MPVTWKCVTVAPSTAFGVMTRPLVVCVSSFVVALVTLGVSATGLTVIVAVTTPPLRPASVLLVAAWIWKEAVPKKLLAGVNLTTWASGKKTFEFLRIADTPTGPSYFASPGGRAPVEFKHKESGSQRIVFENAAHDFPQRILYWREGDVLVARIEGKIREKERSEAAFRTLVEAAPCLIVIVRPGIVLFGLTLQHDDDLALLSDGLLGGRDGRGAAERDREHDLGEENGVANRHDDQRVGRQGARRLAGGSGIHILRAHGRVLCGDALGSLITRQP